MRAITFGVAVATVGVVIELDDRLRGCGLTAPAGCGGLSPADVFPDAHHNLVVGGVVAVVPVLLQLLDQSGGQGARRVRAALVVITAGGAGCVGWPFRASSEMVAVSAVGWAGLSGCPVLGRVGWLVNCAGQR